MPLWRCPHCATPQPESARCWLCGRSTTTCGACRHFHSGVAGGLGVCGKHPRRLALRGTEVLPCWEAVPPAEESPARESPGMRAPRWQEGGPRTFVPVDELRAPHSETVPVAAPRPVTGSGSHDRWSLWGEPDA